MEKNVIVSEMDLKKVLKLVAECENDPNNYPLYLLQISTIIIRSLPL